MTTAQPPLPLEVPARVATAPDDAPSRPKSRKPFVVVGVLLFVLLAGAFIWWLTTRGKVTTDDAEVQADVVPLAPRVGGAVARVLVQDNAHVRAGEVVLEIDDADYSLKVRQAEAALSAAEAELVRVTPQERFDTRDLARSNWLSAGGAITRDQLERAQVAAGAGRAGVMQAQANLASARAALDVARLQLSYTKVAAPGDGRVSDIAAHPGQILVAEQPFAQFVPDSAYVVANFKETQVGAMHPGQRASIALDTYGHRSFVARVESLSAGTGAEFSLLPPNNATGNFVKVVQRVPVRLRLVDPPPDLPLRAGLSADVTVYLD